MSLLEKRDYKFASLEEALRDPAYATPDLYVGPEGVTWLERWQVALGKPFHPNEPKPPKWAQDAYRRTTGREPRDRVSSSNSVQHLQFPEGCEQIGVHGVHVSPPRLAVSRHAISALVPFLRHSGAASSPNRCSRSRLSQFGHSTVTLGKKGPLLRTILCSWLLPFVLPVGFGPGYTVGIPEVGHKRRSRKLSFAATWPYSRHLGQVKPKRSQACRFVARCREL